MTISSAKKLVVVFVFFLFTSPPTTAEIHSETPDSSPTTSHFNQTCSLYSILFAKCVPQLSFVFFGLSLYYLIYLVKWMSVGFKIKQSYRRIHFLMGGLILMKAATLIYTYYEYETVKFTGIHGSDLFFYIYQFIRVVQLFIVVQLIGSGWCFVAPFLQPLDKIVLLYVIPLQFVVNLAEMLIGENGDWKNVNDMFVLVGLFASTVMLFPILASLVSKHNAKLIEIRWFCYFVMMKLLFMGFARITRNNYRIQEVNAINADILSSNVVLEMMNLVFYMTILDFFRGYFDDLQQSKEV